jgi:hypothetical protein
LPPVDAAVGLAEGAWEEWKKEKDDDCKAELKAIVRMAGEEFRMLCECLPRDFLEDRDPVPIRARKPGVPRPLADLVDLALREEPDMPFRTAADFKHALEYVA